MVFFFVMNRLKNFELYFFIKNLYPKNYTLLTKLIKVCYTYKRFLVLGLYVTQ